MREAMTLQQKQQYHGGSHVDRLLLSSNRQSPLSRVLTTTAPLVLLVMMISLTSCVTAASQQAQLQATIAGSSLTTNKRRRWASNKNDIMGTTRRIPNVIALQSRYVHDEVTEISLNQNNDDDSEPIVDIPSTVDNGGFDSTTATNPSEQLVPWNKERKTLNHIVSSCFTLITWSLLAHQLLFSSNRTMATTTSSLVTSIMTESTSTFLNVPYRTWLCISIICYLLEAITCSTRRYLSNMLSPQELINKVNDMCFNSPPIITWKIECYHYNHKGHHYYNKGGHKYGDESSKVITHRATRNFTYTG